MPSLGLSVLHVTSLGPNPADHVEFPPKGTEVEQPRVGNPGLLNLWLISGCLLVGLHHFRGTPYLTIQDIRGSTQSGPVGCPLLCQELALAGGHRVRALAEGAAQNVPAMLVGRSTTFSNKNVHLLGRETVI